MIIRALLVMCLPLGPLAAQSLQITSPTDGTVVNPGQQLTVNVAVSGAFQEVAVVGQSPFGTSQQSLNAPPYQFTMQVPSAISPGQYTLTGVGVTASGPFYSDPILVDVERADNPISIRVEPTILNLYPGQMGYLRVTGLFNDSTTLDLTQSGLITYASDTPGAATVGPQGIVTPVAPGSASVTAAYGSLSITVPVTVPQPLKLAPPRKALYASQTARFYAQPSGLSNPSIAWSVVPNGLGSIDGTGLYTAPSAISTQQTITVMAANAADNTQFATATVLLYPIVAVTIQPGSVTLNPSQTQAFTTGVANAVSQGVSWTISPSGTGSIATSGLYTPPSSILAQQTVTLTATSWWDSTKSASATVTLMPLPVSATPTFSPSPGTYTSTQNVIINTATSGASIRYTIDGSTPTETVGTLYSGQITVSATTTINAIAYESGFADSSVASATYTIAASQALWVVDGGNSRVEKLDSNGNYLAGFGSYGSGNAQFLSPCAIAVDSNGNVWVVDSEGDRVQEFSSGGTYMSQFGTFGFGNGQFNGPSAIAIDASGNFWVADWGNSRVQEFSAAAAYLDTIRDLRFRQRAVPLSICDCH